MRIERDLPFPFPPGFPDELEGTAPDEFVRATRAIVEDATRGTLLPFLSAVDEADAVVALETACAAFADRREELLTVLDVRFGRDAVASLRRHALAFASRTLRDAPESAAARGPLLRALAHCELSTELALACPPRVSAAVSADLRRHAIRLELGLFGGLSVARGDLPCGRGQRAEILAAGALLSARRVHALLMDVTRVVRSPSEERPMPLVRAPTTGAAGPPAEPVVPA